MIDDIDLKMRMGIRKDALTKHYNKLRDARIDCTMHETGLTGTYKKEPYVVYAAFIFPLGARRPDIWVMEVRTRFKGKEYPGELPLAVLKREG